MAKIGTKNVQEGGNTGGFTPKMLQPGKHYCKINGVEIQEIDAIPGACHLVLNLEGIELKDFQGFPIDPKNTLKGYHKGQVGNVKFSEFYFKDGKTRKNFEIFRDEEILKALKTICKNSGTVEWFESQDGLHDTIEQLVSAFNKDKPFANKWFYFCIGAKSYKNKKGYTAYDLFLVRPKVGSKLFSSDTSKVNEFSEEYIKPIKGSTSTSVSTGSSNVSTGGAQMSIQDEDESPFIDDQEDVTEKDSTDIVMSVGGDDDGEDNEFRLP